MPHKAAFIETLPEDLRQTVEGQVRRGDHASPEEAIREAIVLHEENLALRRSVITADTAIERGQFLTPAQSKQRSTEVLDSLKKRDG